MNGDVKVQEAQPTQRQMIKLDSQNKITFTQIDGDVGPQCVLKVEGGFFKV